MELNPETKPAWCKPVLEEHGSVEQVTQGVAGPNPDDGLFADGTS